MREVTVVYTVGDTHRYEGFGSTVAGAEVTFDGLALPPSTRRQCSGACEPLSPADAALAVEAVNAYDRLRRIESAAREYVAAREAMYDANAAWALTDDATPAEVAARAASADADARYFRALAALRAVLETP